MSLNNLNDELNIDSPNFHEEKAFLYHLKNNNISNIIQKSNELHVEIKGYDQEIQSLVFENYNKFITSIDIVKRMKTDILKVDEKLKSLSNSINIINTHATKIDDTLKIKRNEIQKLDTINKDLQKLKMLCELPKVLRKDLLEYKRIASNTPIHKIDHDYIFKESCEYYHSCGQMLIKFQHEPLIRPIYKESHAQIEEVHTILWNLELNPSLNEEALRKITKKLIIFASDENKVLQSYLTMVKDRIKKNTKDILESPNNASGVFITYEEEATKKFLNSKNYDITTNEFEDFKYKLHKEMSESEDKGASYIIAFEKLSKTVTQDLKKEISFLLQDLIQYLKKNTGNSTEKIEHAVKDMIYSLIQKVSEILTHRKIPSFEVHECLKKLNEDLVDLTQLINSKNLRTEIFDKFGENIENIIRGQLINAFTSLKNSFINLLFELISSTSNIPEIMDETEAENFKKSMFGLTTTLKNKLYSSICETLIDLKIFISSQDTYLKSHFMFMSLLHTQFSDYMKTILRICLTRGSKISQDFLIEGNLMGLNKHDLNNFNKDLMNAIINYYKIEETSSYYILIIHFTNLLQKKYIQKIFETFFDLFHKNPNYGRDAILKSQYQSLKQNMESYEIANINNYIKTDQWRAYINYGEKYYEELSIILNDYFHPNHSAWNSEKEPRDITPDIEKICLKLRRMFNELIIIYPDFKRILIRKDNFLKNKNLNLEMQKMLARKSHLYEKEYSRNLTILHILKGLMKIYMDKIRRIQLNKYGYQQMQVDLYMLTQLSYEMVPLEDENLIIGFYYEIIDNANERTFEIIPLDNNIIETITNVKRNKWKFQSPTNPS